MLVVLLRYPYRRAPRFVFDERALPEVLVLLQPRELNLAAVFFRLGDFHLLLGGGSRQK